MIIIFVSFIGIMRVLYGALIAVNCKPAAAEES